MADAGYIMKRMRELPPAVQDFIFAENAHEHAGKVIARSDLNDEQTLAAFGLLKEIYVRDVPLDKIIQEIRKRMNFDEDKAKRLAVDIAGYQLLPLDKWLGDVDGYVRRLGADPKFYPPERIQVVTRSADEAASETLGSVGNAASFEAVLRKRQEDMLKSFFSGVRTEAQLKDVLMKPTKTGGMGLDEMQARTVVEAALEEKRTVNIETFSPGTVSAPPLQAAPGPVSGSETAPPAPVKKPDAFGADLSEDETEILKFKQKTAAATPFSSRETAERIEASTGELYAQSGYQAPDEALQKRLKTIIGNRLRDVRDSLETLEALSQARELGGMGMSQDEARRVLGLIEEKLRAVHEAHKAEVAAEKRKWVENEQTKRSASEADAARREEEERERLFATLLAKTGKASDLRPQTSSPGPQAPSAAPAVREVPPPPNLPAATPSPVPPAMRPPAVIPPPPPKPEAPVVQRPPLTIVRPPMPAPSVPAGLQLKGEAARPRLEDVKPAVRLTGPVEEIRSMSLADFRRLSDDPKQASVKVKDKIDLLQNESYEKRTQAIAAWTESEINRTYLEMMREALAGKSMAAVIEARKAAGQPALSTDEVAAVADLNRQLRY